MDVRRYQQAREKNLNDDVDISGSTFPGLVTLSVGVFVIIVGIILIAAFGVPKDVSVNMKPLSGVSVVGFGLLISAIGIGIALYLKKKNLERKRARKRAEQRRQRQKSQQTRQGYEQGQGRYEPQQLCVPPAGGGHHSKIQPATELAYANSSYAHENGLSNAETRRGNATNGAVPTVHS